MARDRAQKERVAGFIALALGAAVAGATASHVVQMISTIAAGRVADSSVDIDDGALVATRYANGGTVSAGDVIAGLVSDATIFGVVALVAVIGISLVRGRPFGSRMPVAVALTGALIAVGGTVSATLASFGDRGPSLPGGDSISAPLELPLGFVTISLLPLAAGLTIILLAFVFRSGVRLQHDTDGLV